MPVCAELLLRNVPNLPGPSGGEYSTGAAQGGVIYPSTRNGVDPGPGPPFSAKEDNGSYDSSGSSHTDTRERNSGTVDVAATPEVSATYRDAYLQLESFQVQLGIGYAASSGPPPIPRRTRPTAYQPYPVQPTYVARSPHPSDVPHQQDPVAVITTSSQPPSMPQSPRPSAYRLCPVQLAYVAARSPHPSDVPHQQSPVAVITTSSQPPHIPQSTHPTAHQPYPVQLAYVATRSPHPSDVPHQQDLVAVIATSSQSPHMPQSPHPNTYQPYPLQTVYAARSHHPSDVPHQQNPVAVTATSSQYQGSAFVQDALGRPYYQQWYPILPCLAAVSN